MCRVGENRALLWVGFSGEREREREKERERKIKKERKISYL